MTIVGKRTKSRDKAVYIVNEFIKSFTKVDSDKLEKQGKLNFEHYSQMAWSMGIGGWYYDQDCTQFCTDKIIEHIQMTHYGELVEEMTDWRDGQN
jgi:uncharacterized protein YbcV (DUF1398 family)